MKWPWQRTNTDDEAELERAERQLSDVRDQWPAVHRAAAQARAHKDRNHFADKIAAIYAGRQP